MARIVVTGARGLLGSTLVPCLIAKGHEVLRSSRQERPGHVRLDLADAGQVADALDRLAPEVIVNLAALSDVDTCERNPHDAYLGNVRPVETLVTWMASSSRPCHLIQMSTDQLYDGPGPHVEDDVTISNFYGLSKYAGELAAARVPSTVLRTNFFGASASAERVSLSDWLVTSLQKGDAIRVYDDVRFSPLGLARLSEFVEIVVDRRIQGTFNVGASTGMSKADFAFALAEAMHLPVAGMARAVTDEQPLRTYRPKDMTLDSRRFSKSFGVTLPTLMSEIELVALEYAREAR